MLVGENASSKLGRLILPWYWTFFQRYANNWSFKRGSKYINPTPCPLCERFLRGYSCAGCPIDAAFGKGHFLYGEPGCKVAIKQVFGPFTFIDHPKYIASSAEHNPQLEEMHRWGQGLVER